MSVRYISSLVAICLMAGVLALPAPALTEPAPARMSPTRVASPAETQRALALKATFAATRPQAIDQAYLEKLAASPVVLPSKLTPAQVAELKQIGQLARRGDHAALGQRWGAFAAGLPLGTTPADVTALMQWVLRESYLQSSEDLSSYADKVKYFNELKKGLRQEIEKMRSMKSAAQARGSVKMRVVTRLPVFRSDTGFPPTIPGQERTLTPADLDEEIAKLEAMLQTVGEDAQLANIDLQNALQRQQQTLQMMSRISRLLYDTLMGIVRKLGG